MSTSNFSNRLLLLMAGAALFYGCSHTTEPQPTPGVVHGVITGGHGQAVDGAGLTLTAIDFDGIGHATTDESGEYRFEVPPGRYRLSLHLNGYPLFSVVAYYSSAGPVGDWDKADTLHVARSPSEGALEANMSLGAVRLVMDLPPELEGETVGIDFIGWGGGSYWKPAQMVTGGKVELTAESLRPDSYSASGYLPNGEPIAFPEGRFQVRSGECTELEWSIPRPGFVRGRFTGSWQELGLDAPVIELVDGEGRHISRARASSDGTFELTLFRDALVLIETTLGFRRLYDETGTAWGEPFFVASGTVYSDVHIRELGIYGEVIGPDGYHPTRGQVDLFAEGGEDMIDSYSLESPRAAFHFSGLLPGTYFLLARTPYSWPVPWAGQWYDGAETRDDATPITIDWDTTATEVSVSVPWAESPLLGF